MSSQIVDAAAAVVTALNAASLSQAFTAERTYDPDAALENLSTLTVLVVPKSGPLTIFTRGKHERAIGVDVAIAKRLASTTAAVKLADGDAMMLLAEEVEELFLAKAVGAAYCASTERDPIYDPLRMREKGLFLTVISLICTLHA